ncbi:MRG/MORF4L-binding protein [Drosophila sulfurigaster albostrigata]|uniref:MRG/MORF4L-binding protein n=1 Tax=Drosophila sulfurigaster albostrigata TaxID=89887 RepID=UPI002D21E20F|nr:MRG/MORF4L-binding protein [Drosophila sulfurigaster albostrigata]
MSTKDEWSAEEELQLFHAMEGLRPVGVNKHFYMSCISERLSKSLNREMPSDLIWRHLGTMYKLKELDNLESLPFPNEEREFSLPEQDYASFVSKKTTATNDGDEVSEATTENNTSNKGGKFAVLQTSAGKDVEKEKKSSTKALDLPKRSAKRTRGSMSNESISPSTTPPPMQNNKRRRI